MVDWTQVSEQFGPALSRVAAAYAPPGADRDDLQQEIALALLSALPRYRQESSLRTYVLRIAHNCGIRHISRRRAAAEIDEQDHAAPTTSPESQTAAREEVERLSAGLRELPVGMRQVLALTLEGLSQREIADALGIEENLVSVRLHRARQLLAQRLGENAKPKGSAYG